MTIAPLRSGECLLHRRGVALAVTSVSVMSIAPHQASAKGGTFHLGTFVLGAEAAPLISSRTETAKPDPLSFGGCGGKRYRDPNTHRCRSPSDFGN